MLSPTDRLEIHELYARYAHSFDKGHAADWAGLFVTDGSFDIDGTRQLHGREELEQFARSMFTPPGMRHFVSNLLLTSTADGAVGQAYVQVMRLGADTSLRMLNLGEYDDVLAKIDSSWRFRSRRFTSWLPAGLADATLSAARER